MEDFQGVGVHPLKKLRNQTLEEFEEFFTGQPSATLVRMKKQEPPSEEKTEEEVKKDFLFVPIIEKTENQPN